MGTPFLLVRHHDIPLGETVHRQKNSTHENTETNNDKVTTKKVPRLLASNWYWYHDKDISTPGIQVAVTGCVLNHVFPPYLKKREEKEISVIIHLSLWVDKQ